MAYRTILLAYDGSRDGRRVLLEGIEVARCFGARTHLLAVITARSGAAFAQSLAAAGPAEHAEFFREMVAEGVAYFRHHGLDVEGHVAQGQPVEEIARFARAVAADLVVVGHRAHGPLARWWTTPTCMSLLDRLDCGVLVCRQHAEAGAQAAG